MEKPDQLDTIKDRKILLAIDATTSSVHYLEKAAELASILQAQLVGLYIEDEDLLAAADLPFTKEICFHVNERPVNQNRIAWDLKLFSGKTQECLKKIATQWNINWSFETVRGKVGGELSQAAQKADIVSFDMQVYRDLQYFKTTENVLQTELPCLLFPNQLSNGEDVIVYASENKSLDVLLSPILELVQRSRLIIYCTPNIYAANKEHINSFLQRSTRENEVIITSNPTEEWGLELLASYNPRLIIVDKHSDFTKSEKLYTLLRLTKASGLLV